MRVAPTWSRRPAKPLSQIKLIGVDYDQIEKDAAALKKRFNEIFQ